MVWVSLAMVGGLIGFLFFNFPPARIFLGDGGAYLIGSAISTLSLVSSNKGSIAAALLVIVVALGIPIADTLFALLRRFIKGYPIFHADAGHIHHRLQKIGFSKRRMVLGMYVGFLILGLFGLSIFWSQGRTLPIVGGVLFLTAIFAIRNLGYAHSWTHLRLKLNLALNRRTQVRFALLGVDLLGVELERSVEFEDFEALLRSILKGVGFFVSGEGREKKGVEGRRVEVRLSDGTTLKWEVPDEGDIEHWENLAGLFRPVLNQSLKKWSHGKFNF